MAPFPFDYGRASSTSENLSEEDYQHGFNIINPQLHWIWYNCMILQQAGLQFSQIFKTPKPTRNFILAHWLDVLEDTIAKAYNYLNHVAESIARLTTAYETQGIFTFLDTTKQIKTLRGYSKAVKLPEE